jgi:hypothetical protein
MSAPTSTRLCAGRALALALLATVGTSPAVVAQLRDASVGAAVAFQGYSFDQSAALGIQNVRLLSLQFSATAPLVEQLSLVVTGAYARGTMNRASLPQFEISGLTDTQVSLTYSPNVYLNVTGIVIAPTGKETQTLEESLVAGAMASDLLPFRVSNWGSGGGGGVNASVAHPMGPVGAGLSVGYIAGREFEPLSGGVFAYRPGGLLRIVGALDGTVGEASKASLKVTYHRYGQDKINGYNLFQSGDRFQALASLAFPMGTTSSGIAYASLTHRQRSTLLGDLPIAQESASQNLFVVGGGFRRALGSAVLQPDAELRMLSRANDTGKGFDLAIGATLVLRSTRAMFAPSAKLHMGRLDVGSGESSRLLGFEVGLSARVGGGS